MSARPAFDLRDCAHDQAVVCDLCFDLVERFVALLDRDDNANLSICLGCLAQVQISAAAVFRALAKRPRLHLVKE